MKIRVVDSLVSILPNMDVPEFWVDGLGNRVLLTDLHTDVVINLVELIAMRDDAVLEQIKENGFWDGDGDPMHTMIYHALVAEQEIRLDPPETKEKAAKKKKGRKKKAG